MIQFMAILFLVTWVICSAYIWWQCSNDGVIQRSVLSVAIGLISATGVIVVSLILIAAVGFAMGFTL